MKRFCHSQKHAKGFALIGALVLLTIVSAAVMAIMSFSMSMNHLTTKKITLEQTLYIAESGVYQAIHWFNKPNESPAPSTIQALINTYGIDESPFEKVNVTNVPPADTTLVTLINNPTGSSSRYCKFPEGHVKRLQVKGPRPDSPPDTIFTFCSTAVSADRKIEQTVIADVIVSKFSGIIIPAAITAGANVSAKGQFNLHWGEAWALGNIQVPGKISGGQFSFSKWFPTVSKDPLAKIITTGMIYGNDGLPLAPAAPPRAPVPPQSVAQSPRLSSYDPEYDNMFQLWDRSTQPGDRLNIPDGEGNFPQKFTETVNELLNNLDYQIWKDLALERGQYYRPNSSGEFFDFESYPLYVDSVTNEITRESKSDGKTNARATIKSLSLYPQVGEFDDASIPADIVFIDTLDGNPPYDNGQGDTNLCSVSLTGGSTTSDYFYTKGVLYVCGNLYIGGLGPGSTPALALPNPNTGSSETVNIWHNGLIVTEGSLINQGNASVFGSIVAKKSVYTGGTPDVYYDVRLKNGLVFPFASRVSILQWLS
jgi:hypothetical protein